MELKSVISKVKVNKANLLIRLIGSCLKFIDHEISIDDFIGGDVKTGPIYQSLVLLQSVSCHSVLTEEWRYST